MEADLMTVWKNNYTYTLIIFLLVTLVQFLVIAIAFKSQWLQDITTNFPKYRCNPIVMPFVSLIGHNTVDNFNFCVQGIFNSKAAEVFIPIYGLMATFQEVLMTVVNAAMSIRGMFSNFFTGVEHFITSIRNKIQYLMNNVRMSFIRIFNLMGKVYGSMFAVLFMGQSAMTAAFNLADNDLVKFLFEFCFAPDTPVRLRNGLVKPISQIQIGDILAPIVGNPNPVVESVFRFSGTHTRMVEIHGVVLSSEHYVQLPYSKQMVPAKDHPLALSVDSIPELVCLNVSGHRFAVGTQSELIVSDYDEHSIPRIIAKTQRIASRALNGSSLSDTLSSGGPLQERNSDCGQSQDDEFVDEYSLGIGGDTEMELADGTWKRTDSIHIGDRLKHAGTVLGIVQEQCSNIVYSPEGIAYSPSQFVYDHSAHRWVRSGLRWPEGKTHDSAVLYNVITHCSSAIHTRGNKSDEYIRDYREVPLPEMEAEYEKEFLNAQPETDATYEKEFLNVQ